MDNFTSGCVQERHILVPTAPESALASEVVTRRLLEQGVSAKNIYTVWMLTNFRPPRLPDGVTVFQVPDDLLVTETLPKEVIKRFRAAHWWRRLLKQHPEVLCAPAHWYIDKPTGFATNHAWRRRDRLSLSLLPDGLLGYTNAPAFENGWRTRARKAVETLAAMSAGGRYEHTPNTSHSTRFETGAYDQTFTFRKDGQIAFSGEIIEIDRPIIAAMEANPRVAVIADQELTAIVGPKDEVRVRRALYETLNALDLDRVYYKPHPRYSSRLTECKASIRHDVVLCERPGAVEEFVAEEGAGILISFFSASLRNAVSPSGLRRIAILPPPIQTIDPGLSNNLIGALEGDGVEVKTVNTSASTRTKVA